MVSGISAVVKSYFVSAGEINTTMSENSQISPRIFATVGAMKREDAYFEAMRARDHRFDGKFFVGVKTTGIYCRPICPAKPKRENVEFFASMHAAERAGYRPCLRCRPESAPQSAAWIGKSAVVQRALKHLQSQSSLQFNEDEFAAKFGVSARHLRRLFIEEIGKTPKQLAFESRLSLSRKLISETALPIAEIAFASGFSSIRRFNDAFKERFKRSPVAIRRARVKLKDSSITVTLPYRPPFDYKSLLHFYRTHQVGRLEKYDIHSMHRLIHFDGKSGWIKISDDAKNSRLILEIDFPDTSRIHSIVARVRAMFDLDSDPLLIANSLEADPKIKALLKLNPGVRVPSGWEGFEVAAATILGQLVSVDMGRMLIHDLIEMLGQPSGLESDGVPIKLFPTPRAIAENPLEGLRTTNARKQTLREFSGAVAEGRLSLDPAQDPEKFVEDLLALRGIGPWSANYMAMKVIRHADAFPGTDLILARALEIHTPEVVERMSPWRAYVAALFWREYSIALKKTTRRKK